jgi:hypothetical protein
MRDSPQNPAHSSLPSSAPSTDLKRRRFLLAVSAGGAGAVAAASPARAAAVVAPTGTAAAEGASGYQETGHVKRYYDTTRI